MKKMGLLLVFFCSTSYALAQGQIVNCSINNDYRGKCRFVVEKGGSFSLSHPNRQGQPLFSEITDVSVYIVARNQAEVRGLTTAGINSRWGEAVRSRRNPACWVGSDFEVCAWK